MDAKLFRESFLHPDILELFASRDEDGNVIEPLEYPTVDNFFKIAKSEGDGFVSSVPQNLRGLFDVNIYIAKRTMVLIYGWLLQNKAELTNFTASSLNVSDGDIFENFNKLKEAEEEDLKAMRNEILGFMDKHYENASVNGVIRQGARVNFAVAKNRITGRYR